LRRFWWGRHKGEINPGVITLERDVHTKDHGQLGFQYFEIFNPALLAHQGWRMLQNSGLLSTWVSKSVLLLREGFVTFQGRRASLSGVEGGAQRKLNYEIETCQKMEATYP
jgi:hypothetical protein